LKKFNVPKYLYLGTSDVVCHENDLHRLVKLLPEQNTKFELIDDYNHLDYVWGMDAHQKFYPKVLESVNTYSD